MGKISAKDLERGYTDTGVIPEQYDDLLNPLAEPSEAGEYRPLNRLRKYQETDDGVGFIDRDSGGMDRC